MLARIICIGNPFIAADAAGPMVYGILAGCPLPASVNLVDGGLAGLRLLPLFEGCNQVIVVDAVEGFRADPGVIILDPATMPSAPVDYGHQAGLAYLLQAIPHILDPPVPEVVVVGIEGPATVPVCRQAARLCLDLVGSENGCPCRPESVSAG
ncbi:hydrogenase maturation protease [Desulfoprunum benzoelyticum]|uniref:Hydrogenase maturation protease n=1 Tax=Desulfoprunum benzoelyticum TaxID=1506996 RepID=A0A840USG3_9BACT|nr:hydrogenase maturation protease [Desulfoprunum benzoelyticum]MBB5346314.1 hydrogenase maturation protease [Desulfoprunum benzoelyticum]MBM9528687.1 hydrogenase maturation protease [Desulfoprunum benzoelyticum]